VHAKVISQESMNHITTWSIKLVDQVIDSHVHFTYINNGFVALELPFSKRFQASVLNARGTSNREHVAAIPRCSSRLRFEKEHGATQ